jgi:hypothetical protein
MQVVPWRAFVRERTEHSSIVEGRSGDTAAMWLKFRISYAPHLALPMVRRDVCFRALAVLSALGVVRPDPRYTPNPK